MYVCDIYGKKNWIKSFGIGKKDWIKYYREAK